MNKKVLILKGILKDAGITQRRLAEEAGLSLGSINTELRKLRDDDYIQSKGREKYLTPRGLEYLESFRVDGAVILAAGFGTRFVPLSFEMPKGLIEVYGEPMIERQIRQLLEAGIEDIAIVVGYMKERFEYLIDRFGVRLIFNPEYETKNNLSSVHAAREFIRGRNIYLLSSDHWMKDNIFSCYESDSWYAARHFEGITSEWTLLTDRTGRITEIYPGGRDADCMYGPAFLSGSVTEVFMKAAELLYAMPGTDDLFWEDVLREMLDGTALRRIGAWYGDRVSEDAALLSGIDIYIKLLPEGAVYEFESLEELRTFDPKYMDDSGSRAMQVVSRALRVPESDITRIRRLKAGMTNQSWLFSVDGAEYISRVPGEGTDMLINRHEERAAYEAVRPLGITEDVVYFDEESGDKISLYFESSRTADPDSADDMARCMEALRSFHESGVTVPHSFDIGAKIRFYEALTGGVDGIPFRDYGELIERRDSLLSILNELDAPRVLAHVDAVSDNFLFVGDKIKLIDWEYAGMCDPLVDPAMCAIYSYRDEEGALFLLRAYLGREPLDEERMRIYAYMALGGLLWALWGVYKEQLGVRFTDYTLRMYRYFKEYSLRALDIYVKR